MSNPFTCASKTHLGALTQQFPPWNPGAGAQGRPMMQQETISKAASEVATARIKSWLLARSWKRWYFWCRWPWSRRNFHIHMLVINCIYMYLPMWLDQTLGTHKSWQCKVWFFWKNKGNCQVRLLRWAMDLAIWFVKGLDPLLIWWAKGS